MQLSIPSLISPSKTIEHSRFARVSGQLLDYNVSLSSSHEDYDFFYSAITFRVWIKRPYGEPSNMFSFRSERKCEGRLGSFRRQTHYSMSAAA